MSLIFIDRIQTYSTVINKKCSELEEFVTSNYSFVITDNKGLLQLDKSIQNKIKDLEQRYPKSKAIQLYSSLSGSEGYISAHPDGNPEKTIFRLTYVTVRAKYLPQGKSTTYLRQSLIKEGGQNEF